MIKRVRCEEDRRAVYVSITDEGLQVLSTINFVDAPAKMQNLSEEEVTQLSTLLDKIRN